MDQGYEVVRTPQRAHLVGIGGIGMASLAGLLQAKGMEVRGSDSISPFPPSGTLLRELGIEVMYPYAAHNLRWRPELLVIGNVVRADNPEAVEGARMGLARLSMPDALRRFFLADAKPLVVAGTHGKTTTSALVAWLLDAIGASPSFLIGGMPLNFPRPFRLGCGEYFVMEGDEYDSAFFQKTPKFWHYSAHAAIVGNVEFDHADIYPDLDAVVQAFIGLVERLPGDGLLVLPESDATSARVGRAASCARVTFGIGRGDYAADGVRVGPGGVVFDLVIRGRRVCRELKIRTLGRFNLLNALAGLALVCELAGWQDCLAWALTEFTGVRKRQELVGREAGVSVYYDFAHHPTAVRETARAFRLHFPKARIIAVFEPESNTSRRRVFQDRYVDAFLNVDTVFFTKLLEKPDGLEPHERLDLGRLCQELQAACVDAWVVEEPVQLAARAAELAMPGDVIVCMSGRDCLGIHHKILEHLKSRARSSRSQGSSSVVS